MPKCEITTGSGEHTLVEADGFQLLPDTGFVILKRREKGTEGKADQDRAVAIFYKPDKVLLPVPTEAGDSVSGSFAG